MGYNLSSWFALESGVTHYEQASATYDTGSINSTMWSAKVSPKFSFKLNDSIDAYTKINLDYFNINQNSDWNHYSSFQSFAISPSIGFEYTLNNNWSIQSEYQYTNGIENEENGLADIYSLSLGASYHFSSKKTSPSKLVKPITTTNSSILFDFDSTKIKETPELQSIINNLLQNDLLSITLIGHTDNTGEDKYNLELSMKRALEVKSYLLNLGLPENKIRTYWQGEKKPNHSNSSKESRSYNRCVNITYLTKNIEI